MSEMKSAPTTREGLLALPVWEDYSWMDERAGMGFPIEGDSLLACVDDDGEGWAPVCDRDGNLYRAEAWRTGM